MNAPHHSAAADRASTQRKRGTVTVPCPVCGALVGLNPASSVVRHRSALDDDWCAGAGAYSLSGAIVAPVPGDDEVTARRRGTWVRRQILPRALAFVETVREEHRLGIGAALAGLDRVELEALAVVLAAMVPEDRSPQELLGWISWDDAGRPVGRRRRGGREQVAA